MNSITEALTAGSIIGVLRMLRSARKEIFFIVEGDRDIAVFSEALKVPKSNFVSCCGKEMVMEVFGLAPCDGLDSGTIFIRDADCDGVRHTLRDEVQLLVSDDYDFEMSLLKGRLFARILAEFLKSKANPSSITDAFDTLVSLSAAIGALRFESHHRAMNLKFRDMDLDFIDFKRMTLDIDRMVRYLFARSQRPMDDFGDVTRSIKNAVAVNDPVSLSSGKDLIRLLSVALARYFKCCNAAECSETTLSRMLRIGVVQDDLRDMTFYPQLVARVNASMFTWQGVQL